MQRAPVQDLIAPAHERSPEVDASAGATASWSAARFMWWAGVLASGVILSRRQLSDFDLPWNLATGRLLLQTGEIPRVDELAYTARPLRYVEVLGDAALYAIHSAFGALGLQIFGALIGILTVVWLDRRAKDLGPIRWLWGALGLYALGDWVITRPVLISWLGLSATLGLLERHRSSSDRRRRRRALAGLGPTFLVWANVHGSVALGAALALGYALYAGAVRLMGRRWSRLWPPADGEDAGWTFALVAAALGAACLNTMGPRLLLGPLRSNERFGAITEWAQPTLDYFVRQQPLLSLWLMLSLALWLAGRDRQTGSRIPNAFASSQVLGSIALALLAVRLLPIAAIIMAHALTSRSLQLKVRSLAAAACAVCPLLAALGLALTIPLDRPAGFNRQFLPVDAAEFVASAGLRGRMYNFMPFGGYLALRLWPEHRVFSDGRNALAREPALVEAIARAALDGATFAALERSFRFDFAIVAASEGTTTDPALVSSPDWTMIYLDDTAAVYVRRGGANAALSLTGYRRLRHQIEPSVLLANASAGGLALGRDLAHDGALAVAQAPESPRAAFIAASGALAAGDALAFDAAFLRLAWLAPGHPALALLSEQRRARSDSSATGGPR